MVPASSERGQGCCWAPHGACVPDSTPALRGLSSWQARRAFRTLWSVCQRRCGEKPALLQSPPPRQHLGAHHVAPCTLGPRACPRGTPLLRWQW